MYPIMDKINIRYYSIIGVLPSSIRLIDKSERHGRAKTLLAHAPKLLRFNNIRFPAASTGSVFEGHAG